MRPTQQYQRHPAAPAAPIHPFSRPPTHLDCVADVVSSSAGALLGVAGILTAILQAGRRAGRHAGQSVNQEERQHRLAQAAVSALVASSYALIVHWRQAASRGELGRGGVSPLVVGSASSAGWQGRSGTHLGGANHGLLHIGSGRLDRVLGLAGSVAAGGRRSGGGECQLRVGGCTVDSSFRAVPAAGARLHRQQHVWLGTGVRVLRTHLIALPAS
jgi:hypothetical protein